MDDLEEITKYDYENAWTNHLEQLNASYEKAVRGLNTSVKQYNIYLMEERLNRIKYFKDEKGMVEYVKMERDTIGFKEDESR